MDEVSIRIHEVNKQIIDVRKSMAAYKILELLEKYKYIYIYSDCQGESKVLDILDFMKVPYASSSIYTRIVRECYCKNRKKRRNCSLCNILSWVSSRSDFIESYCQYLSSNNFLGIEINKYEPEYVFAPNIFLEPAFRHLCSNINPSANQSQCVNKRCFELYQVEIPVLIFEEASSENVGILPILHSRLES